MMATTGARSMLASASPVTRFVAPRPERGQADARFAGQPPVGIRHESRGLFVTAENKIDPAVVQRQHQVGVFLAGDAEDSFDPFSFEATDK